MEKTFVISASTEDILRTLQRMTSLLSRNRLKPQRIQVAEHETEQCDQLSLTVRADEHTVEKLIKQLRKMADILEVKLERYQIKQYKNRRYDYAKKTLFRN